MYKLSLLAALLEKDLLGGLLWTDQVKGVGAGPIAEIVEYEEFNNAELAAYRGVLDDIAKETGGRATRQEIANPKDKDGADIPFKIHTIEVTKTAKRDDDQS